MEGTNGAHSNFVATYVAHARMARNEDEMIDIENKHEPPSKVHTAVIA